MSNEANLPSADSWASFGSGSQAAPSSDKKKDGLFMRLEKRPNPYIVHLVSVPECFRQHWQAFKPIQSKPVISPIYEDSDKDKDLAWSIGDFYPQKKYAVLVIDREDGKLKILQGGEQIFGPIKTYIETQKKSNLNPDPSIWDWRITVGEEKGQVKYTCDIFNPAGGPVKLNEAEAALVANFKIDWRSFFKKPSFEEHRAMWEKIPADKRKNPESKRKGAVTADGARVVPQVTQSSTTTVASSPFATQAQMTNTPVAVSAQPIIAATTTNVADNESVKLF